MKISFIVPSHNEEKTLVRLHQKLDAFSRSRYMVPVEADNGDDMVEMDMSRYEFEFLMVNDGSSDSTLSTMRTLREKDPRVAILSLSRNFGKENAMLAGMDYARGDAVVIIDADMQDPIEVVPEMIYWWERGYKDIYGRRIDRGPESALRKFLSLAFYRTMRHAGNVELPSNVGDFRLLDRSAVNALTRMREAQRFTKGLYCWVGFEKKEVAFNRAERTEGKSNYNLAKLLNHAIDGITSYTTTPLRISTIAGIIVSLSAFAYLIFMFVKTLLWGEVVSGFPTLICVILFLGGMQLLALGIIGEYVGRIFNEVKHRPPYIVESYNEEKTDPLNR